MGLLDSQAPTAFGLGNGIPFDHIKLPFFNSCSLDKIPVDSIYQVRDVGFQLYVAYDMDGNADKA